jgi:hypothetical protein
MALIMNQEAKERVNANVVTVKVLQAMVFPVASQKVMSSGDHSFSQVLFDAFFSLVTKVGVFSKGLTSVAISLCD